MIARRVTTLCLLLATAAQSGCGGDTDRAGAAAEPPPPPPAATNRIDVPAGVRQNLGITFAKVERRPVRQTVRVPGEFRLRHEARREYHAMVPGRVEFLAKPMGLVKAGDPLARIDSPEWRQRQHEAVEAEGEIRLAEAAVQVAEASKAEVEQAVAFLRARLEKLAELNVRRVELEGELATRRTQVPKLDAELRARQTELAEAREHYGSILNVLSSLSGTPRDRLLAVVRRGGEELPYWRTLDTLVLVAEADGVVEPPPVTSGGWAERGTLVLATFDPLLVHFHADAPQSDIGRFRDGQPVEIAPPQGSSVGLDAAVGGTLRVGAQAHAADRTIPLYAMPTTVPAWARPGVGGYLDVCVGGAEQPELAIPTSAIVRDELKLIFYRRDPKNPDKVYPVEADLGASDGRWTVVNSGLADGDEVVLDGAYALKLIGGGQQAPPGYHYHADGTLHKDH